MMPAALSRIFSTVMLALGYQLPQLFQFYAWLWGILVIGATAFTIAQMSRHRELVALLASGWNLQRVTVPILVVTGGLGVVQILNQELVLPRMAPLLLRTHEQAGQAGVRSFSIPITVDSNRRLLQASDFDPIEERLLQPNFIERTVDGLAVRRIRADRADWNPASDSWVLQNGIVTSWSVPMVKWLGPLGLRPSNRSRPIFLLEDCSCDVTVHWPACCPSPRSTFFWTGLKPVNRMRCVEVSGVDSSSSA